MTVPLLYAIFFLSGAAGLMYESVWTRYLGLFVGHDAYAQVLVLVIFLGGMSAGAAMVSRVADRLRNPLLGYALMEGAAGLIGLTEAIGTTRGYEDFAEALISIMSIALGVLIGTALYRVVHQGAAEIADFHIDVPAALAEETTPPFWARLLPGTPRSFWGRHRGAPSSRRRADASPPPPLAGKSAPSSQATGS